MHGKHLPTMEVNVMNNSTRQHLQISNRASAISAINDEAKCWQGFPQVFPTDAEIVNLQLTPGHGCLRATFDIQVNKKVLIAGFRIVQEPTKKVFVQPPQKTKKLGKKVIYLGPEFSLPKHMKTFLETLVLPRFMQLRLEAN